MKVSRRDVESNLPKKGFKIERDNDHIYFHYWVDGKATPIFTKISHSKKSKDIDGGLLSAMRKQVKLDSNKEFVDLVKCPMTPEQYKEFLVSKERL